MAVARIPHAEDLEVRIGPMRRRHLRSVIRIEQSVYPRPWSMGLFMSELSYRDGRAYVVALVGSTLIGYGGVMLVADDGHVTTLAVDPRWHRHGIGTRLLHALASAAIDRGAKNLTLEVRAGNRGAQELYRSFGFAPAGIRKGYYVETNEDAIIMWANDVDTAEYRADVDALLQAVPGATVYEDLGR